MPSSVKIEIEIPADLARFRLPDGVQERLHMLLDKQDAGQLLTDAERREAEGLVDLAARRHHIDAMFRGMRRGFG